MGGVLSIVIIHLLLTKLQIKTQKKYVKKITYYERAYISVSHSFYDKKDICFVPENIQFIAYYDLCRIHLFSIIYTACFVKLKMDYLGGERICHTST